MNATRREGRDPRVELEDSLVAKRLIELMRDPIRGRFDREHLQAVHHHLFQDLPRHGLMHARPGELRPALGGDVQHIKHRSYETLSAVIPVQYSQMSRQDVIRLEKALTLRPDAAKNLGQAEFANRLANLYGEADYVHPFAEGNSRTLRTFTLQLAEESGYNIQWGRLLTHAAGRDTLYAARDLEVSERKLDTLDPASGAFALAQTTVDRLSAIRYRLPHIFESIVVPSRDQARTQQAKVSAERAGPAAERVVVTKGLARVQGRDNTGQWLTIATHPQGGLSEGVASLTNPRPAGQTVTRGAILHVTDDRVFQQVGSNVIAHRRGALDTVPKPGELVRVDTRAPVHEVRRMPLNPERDQSRSRGRSR